MPRSGGDYVFQSRILPPALAFTALFAQVIWLWYQPFVNEFRQRLGLPAYNADLFQRVLRSTPMLGAYSPGIIPHPADWPDSVHITGYLFLDPQPDWQPSPELQTFLEAGLPPVYIGFGSMAGRNPEQLASLTLEALAKSGQRGLLSTGWGGLHTSRQWGPRMYPTLFS